MTSLSSGYLLKNQAVRNRVVFPPVVCFHYAGEDGLVTDRNADHYRQVAAGGAGIVITEATAVRPEGRLASFQLGIWSDHHIEGHARIARAVGEQGAVSLLQIHHAGLLTSDKVSEVAKGPSPDPKSPRSASMTADEIAETGEAFIQAAVRAQKAGYHGVELHGAHGYLLNQFASPVYNQRTDEYGGTFGNMMRLATGIIRGIRNACGEDFIIGYRMGANTPTLDDGIRVARHLENAGVDILHVSHGGNLLNLPRPPADFDFNWIVYSGTVIRSGAGIPVIAVNEIRTGERADWLLENDLVDFVALGRPQLADPEWTNHVLGEQPVNPCLVCKPKCRWYENSSLCPARKISAKAGVERSS